MPWEVETRNGGWSQNLVEEPSSLNTDKCYPLVVDDHFGRKQCQRGCTQTYETKNFKAITDISEWGTFYFIKG